MKMTYQPQYFSFKKALPVWEEGSEKEPNTNLIFRTAIYGTRGVTLRLAGQMHYVVRLNGDLLFEGPARCADGYNRADELFVKPSKRRNVLSITVEGLYATGFSAVRQASFICAEIEQKGRIVAATGGSGFEAIKFTERIKKTQRYSYQRPFSEAYHFDGTAEKFMRDIDFKAECVQLKVTENKRFITRNVPLPLYTPAELKKIQIMGCVYDENAPVKYKDRSLVEVNEYWTAVKKDELDICASDIADRITFTSGDNYSIYDAKQVYSGLIEANVTAYEETRVVFLFDEILEDGKINYTRLNCCNSIVCDFAPGEYHFSTLQVYCARFIGTAVLSGKAKIDKLEIRKVEYPDKLVKQLIFSDENVQKVFDAGRESFKQNTVDILMDCPSRERAGWLCDSTFISRGEYAFTGKSLVTKNFLENFILAENFPLIPENMIPGCYPSNNDGGCPTNGYILNWALWFIVQLKEYADFSNDISLINGAKDTVYRILEFFKQFTNADGLLERTHGWVLLEYSPANKFQQDICYPLNMLFSFAQKAAGELYGDGALLDKAESLKRRIIEKSYNGEYFIDNEVYRDGKPQKTDNHSEFCQYCAFFMGIANKNDFPELWSRVMLNKPEEHGDFVPAAMFLGKTLKMQLLAENGLFDKAKENLKSFCLNMALRTGTLWEFDDTFASCCHGFQSANVCWLLDTEIKFHSDETDVNR